MPEDRSATVAAGMSTAAAIAAVLALLKSRGASAAPGEFPDELIQLVVAIAASADATDKNTFKLIEEIIKLGIGGQGFPNNVSHIQTVREFCPVLATAVQLPDLSVPNGMQLCIKAWPLNGGLIYIGESQSAATNANQVHPLAASETVNYFVRNADRIWISATVAGESVTLTTERPEVM